LSSLENLHLLDSGRTDPDAAEEALGKLYEGAGLSNPEYIWVGSPLAGFQRVLEEIQRLGLEGLRTRAVENLLAGTVEEQCFCQWCKAISVSAAIHPPNDRRPFSAVTDRAAELVLIQALQRQLRDDLDDPISRIRRTTAPSRNRPYCNPWATRALLGDPGDSEVSTDNPRYSWFRLAAAAGWWWPYQGFAVLSARPEYLATSDGQISRDDGPAVIYPDGWSVNAVWNVLLPEDAFRPGGPNLNAIVNEPNLEVRRVLIDLYSPDRYVVDAGGRLLSEDETGQLWVLESQNSPGREARRMTVVRVVDATPKANGEHRVYWLHVPPTMRTAREAVAWTFGLDSDEYRPEVET
jgi:hypothetical protein